MQALLLRSARRGELHSARPVEQELRASLRASLRSLSLREPVATLALRAPPVSLPRLRLRNARASQSRAAA
jgi:hypothetical protein